MLALNLQRKAISRAISLRIFSSQQRNIIVTSPIFYVNAAPHIGHLYTSVLCDAIARYHRINGDSVKFCTGTDEHGLKIQKRAIEEGLQPYDFCTKYSNEFKRLFSAS